jgi:hypothetical protein
MWLPSRAEEKLTFLPKELTPPNSRRMLICRDQLFKLFGRGEGFVLELAGVQSPEFQGKAWESQAAIDWCISRCRASDAPRSAEMVIDAMHHQQAVVAAEVALEGLWGQF